MIVGSQKNYTILHTNISQIHTLISGNSIPIFHRFGLRLDVEYESKQTNQITSTATKIKIQIADSTRRRNDRNSLNANKRQTN